MKKRETGIDRFMAARLIVILFVFIIAAGCGKSESVGTSVDSATAAKLQQLLNDRTSNANYYNIPGIVLAVNKRGSAQWIGASGVSNLTTKTALTGNESFRVGSISKTFTAIVVLQLAQEGKIGLDDSVSKWLPDLVSSLSKYDLNKITLRMLLNHTSGIHPYTDVTDAIFLGTYENPLTVWSRSDVLSVVNSHSPDFTPGTSWHYSNTNYYILGILIEKITGDTYENQVKTRIIDALGLKDTYVPAPGNPYLTGSFARGYFGIDSLVDYTYTDPSYPWSAGSVVSTPADLATWVMAIYDGTLLNSTYKQQQTTYTTTTYTGMLYGLGIVQDNNYNLFGHRGQTFGYDCTMYYVEGKDTSVAACVNRSLFEVNSDSDLVVLYDALAILYPDLYQPYNTTSAYAGAAKKQAGHGSPLNEY